MTIEEVGHDDGWVWIQKYHSGCNLEIMDGTDENPALLFGTVFKRINSREFQINTGSESDSISFCVSEGIVLNQIAKNNRLNIMLGPYYYPNAEIHFIKSERFFHHIIKHITVDGEYKTCW